MVPFCKWRNNNKNERYSPEHLPTALAGGGGAVSPAVLPSAVHGGAAAARAAGRVVTVGGEEEIDEARPAR